MGSTASTPAGASSDAAVAERDASWDRIMCASPGDIDSADLRITGTIPLALRGGRYLLVGPGQVVVGGKRVHPFDGSGYVRAVSFRRDGGVSLRGRFVRTPTYIAEASAGRVIYRGLATNPSASWLATACAPVPRNVANTTVTAWAGQLLCGWEGGLPYALQPATLETIGEGGALSAALAGGAGGVLAHMRIDRAARRLVCLQLAPGRHTRLRFIEIDAAGARAGAPVEISLPYTLFAHDFFITPRYYVVVGNALKLKLGGALAMLVGAGSLLGAVDVDTSQPGRVHLIPRPSGDSGGGGERCIRVDRPLFAVHIANAFDARDGSGALVVDMCGFRGFTFGRELGYAGPDTPFVADDPERAGGPQLLGRLVIARDATEAAWRDLSSLGCDFPRVPAWAEGTDARDVYVATRRAAGKSDPFDAIARIPVREIAAAAAAAAACGDVPAAAPSGDDLWHAGAGVYVGEPVCAAAEGDEAGGHVLACVYDGSAGGETQLCIFEARAIAAGPVARIHLGALFPMGFHGAWEEPEPPPLAAPPQ